MPRLWPPSAPLSWTLPRSIRSVTETDAIPGSLRPRLCLARDTRCPSTVSLEELIWDRSDDYYDALAKSSLGWHAGGHDLAPFLRFMLEILAFGYKQLEERRERVAEPIQVNLSAKIDGETAGRIEAAIREFYPNAAFTRKELPRTTTSRLKVSKATCPGKHGRRAIVRSEWRKPSLRTN